MCVCVCVCVCEWETEARQKDLISDSYLRLEAAELNRVEYWVLTWWRKTAKGRWGGEDRGLQRSILQPQGWAQAPFCNKFCWPCRILVQIKIMVSDFKLRFHHLLLICTQNEEIEKHTHISGFTPWPSLDLLLALLITFLWNKCQELNLATSATHLLGQLRTFLRIIFVCVHGSPMKQWSMWKGVPVSYGSCGCFWEEWVESLPKHFLEPQLRIPASTY